VLRLFISCAVIFGSVAAVAQSGPGKERSDLMRSMQNNFNVLRNVVQGKEPFAHETVEKVFSSMSGAAEKLPPLWPPGSPSVSDRYASSPRVWETKADFETKMATLQKVLRSVRTEAATAEGLKTVFPQVDRACDSCHETYRLRK
jgi:cytochrome c556